MSTYYVVTLSNPCTNNPVREIGYYTSKQLAIDVWYFMHKVNDNHINFEIKIDNYSAEFVYCPAGIRLKDTPNGKITMLCDKLTREEYVRLMNINVNLS